MLEIGFSRAKNAGTGVAKILTNLSIAAICYWAVGFAFAFGSADVLGISDAIIGTNGFFLQVSGDAAGGASRRHGPLGRHRSRSKWLFQFAFCAVSLAIVWGTTLERIKYSAYVIYAIVFAAIIYPIGSHWVFGGGWLQNGDTALMPTGMQDFAGSTAVHLIGATGALAALLLLGPRKGKYGPDGKPRAIPGHSMPLVGLGMIILFVGWFGFNPGSTLERRPTPAWPRSAMVTLLGAAGGVHRRVRRHAAQAEDDRHRHGRQRHDRRPRRHHGAVGLRRGVGRPAHRLRRRPDRGVRRDLDRQEARRPGRRDCRRTAWPASGARWRAASSRRRGWREYNAFGNPEGGLLYAGCFDQLIAQAVGVLIVFTFVFALSYATFAAIKATIGLRVTEEEEDAGLDIVEHGMYGYPEQFIPQPEIGAARPVRPPAASGAVLRSGSDRAAAAGR